MKHSLGLYFESLKSSIVEFDILKKQTIDFACLANFVALKGGAIKREQTLSADMASIMSNLYLAHCVHIYEMEHQVSRVLKNYVIERLTNENKLVFNRILQNNPFGPLLGFMKSSVRESYQSNRIVMKELETNPLIMEKLKENVYVDGGLEKLLKLDNMDRKSEEYQKLYDDVIQVGKFKIEK